MVHITFKWLSTWKSDDAYDFDSFQQFPVTCPKSEYSLPLSEGYERNLSIIADYCTLN